MLFLLNIHFPEPTGTEISLCVQLYISHFLMKPGWCYGLGTGCNGGFLAGTVEGLEGWIGKPHESKKRKASEEWLSGWNDPSHENCPHGCPKALER